MSSGVTRALQAYTLCVLEKPKWDSAFLKVSLEAWEVRGWAVCVALACWSLQVVPTGCASILCRSAVGAQPLVLWNRKRHGCKGALWVHSLPFAQQKQDTNTIRHTYGIVSGWRGAALGWEGLGEDQAGTHGIFCTNAVLRVQSRSRCGILTRGGNLKYRSCVQLRSEPEDVLVNGYGVGICRDEHTDLVILSFHLK